MIIIHGQLKYTKKCYIAIELLWSTEQKGGTQLHFFGFFHGGTVIEQPFYMVLIGGQLRNLYKYAGDSYFGPLFIRSSRVRCTLNMVHTSILELEFCIKLRLNKIDYEISVNARIIEIVLHFNFLLIFYRICPF